MEGPSHGRMLPPHTLVGALLVSLVFISHTASAVVACEVNKGNQTNTSKEYICPTSNADVAAAVQLSAAGPWGGPGGSIFYDGTANSIAAIQLRHGKAIYSLQTQYVVGSTTHWSQLHGGSDGELVTINLNYEEEYIAQIKGYYGSSVLPCPSPTLNAIQFVVAKKNGGVVKSVGPFGTETGTPFASPAGGKVVGFYGYAGTAIDQIGVYVTSVGFKHLTLSY